MFLHPGNCCSALARKVMEGWDDVTEIEMACISHYHIVWIAVVSGKMTAVEGRAL